MEDLLKEFSRFLSELRLPPQQWQTAQTYIEIIRTNCGQTESTQGLETAQHSLLLSKQSEESELEERVRKMKQDLAFQANIIRDQREMILSLEENREESEVPDTVEAESCLSSSVQEVSRVQQSLCYSQRPAVDLHKSSVFQHGAVVMYPTLRSILERHPELVMSVEFNRIMDGIERGTDIALFIDHEGKIAKILEGKDQFLNAFYVLLENDLKNYVFHDDQGLFSGMDLLVFVQGQINACIIKNAQLGALFVLSPSCKVIIGRNATVEVIHCDAPCLEDIQGFPGTEVNGASKFTYTE